MLFSFLFRLQNLRLSSNSMVFEFAMPWACTDLTSDSLGGSKVTCPVFRAGPDPTSDPPGEPEVTSLVSQRVLIPLWTRPRPQAQAKPQIQLQPQRQVQPQLPQARLQAQPRPQSPGPPITSARCSFNCSPGPKQEARAAAWRVGRKGILEAGFATIEHPKVLQSSTLKCYN